MTFGHRRLAGYGSGRVSGYRVVEEAFQTATKRPLFTIILRCWSGAVRQFVDEPA